MSIGWFSWRRREQREDWSELVRRVASAIRRGEIDLAEWLISDEGDAALRTAECLNLLGVIALSEDNWRRTQQLWQKAARANSAYRPVLQNIRRMYELRQFGKSELELCLGDELQFRSPAKERLL